MTTQALSLPDIGKITIADCFPHLVSHLNATKKEKIKGMKKTNQHAVLMINTFTLFHYFKKQVCKKWPSMDTVNIVPAHGLDMMN